MNINTTIMMHIQTLAFGRPRSVLAALSLVCAILIAAPSRANSLDWVNSLSSGRPSDAIVGGHTNAGAPVYLCRAYHNRDLQPGWTLQGDPACHFSYGGQELSSTDFDWWVPAWVPVTVPGMLPDYELFPFTFDWSTWSSRYVCRAGSTPGKFGTDLGGCSYPFGGTEHIQAGNGFQVLVDLYNGPVYGWGPDYANSYLSNGRMIGPYVARALGPGSASGGGGAPFPIDAIVGGMDIGGQPLYLCSASVGDPRSFQPGKARTDWNACDVSNAGLENYEAQYFVLVPDWVPEYGSNFYAYTCTLFPGCQETTRPIPVGTDSNGSTLYACQVSTRAGVYPGKIAAGFNGDCSYAQNGVENYSASYAILTDGVNLPPYPP